jgi:hypothetical protein
MEGEGESGGVMRGEETSPLALSHHKPLLTPSSSFSSVPSSPPSSHLPLSLPSLPPPPPPSSRPSPSFSASARCNWHDAADQYLLTSINQFHSPISFLISAVFIINSMSLVEPSVLTLPHLHHSSHGRGRSGTKVRGYRPHYAFAFYPLLPSNPRTARKKSRCASVAVSRQLSPQSTLP